MHRVAVSLAVLACLAAADPWRALDPGLDLAELDLPVKSAFGDSRLTAVRIDPRQCRLVLHASGEKGEAGLTARMWAAKHGLKAVINAGMFGRDERPVGYMKKPGFVGNPRLAKERMVLLVDPVDPKLAPARLFDRDTDGPLPLDLFSSALQGIRMIDGKRQPRWSLQPRQWSTAAVGVDSKGRVLLLHARSPYPVRVFIDQLLALPLDVQRAMYLEGGPEASLFVHSGDTELERFGSYETGFFESDSNDHAWPLPNVLAVESCKPK